MPSPVQDSGMKCNPFDDNQIFVFALIKNIISNISVYDQMHVKLKTFSFQLYFVFSGNC